MYTMSICVIKKSNAMLIVKQDKTRKEEEG